ncbi:serine/threonine-protein kinase NIM1-like [Mya arenaria]|uniref:serine/threonine-protein kinase NIM1-like n=1 Tax=Mya arenaria TaxID=6604 RepID=UPI0022E4E8D5|nr:serine/threonine-protein kinase NIM1-like [Mya arenaria]
MVLEVSRMQNGYSSEDSPGDRNGNGLEGEEQHETKVTPFERLSHDLNDDPKVLKEITLGKRIGFYRIRGELGSGNFSQVKMGIHALTKEKVAIKILDKTKLDQKTQRLLSREISSMERLHHPNIIRLYEVVETLAKLHIVMEYAGGGELFTKISNEGKLPEPEARHIFSQVAAAMEHMHSQNIIHRDLKAENVFYAGNRSVKIGDFGFSTYTMPDSLLNTFCGSPPYAAPELFKDESYIGAYVDIWAMGIMLYFIVTGIMPFRADTVAKLKKCILDGSYIIPSYVSDSCQFLIRSTLKAVPQDRFTIQEIKDSEWLESQDFPQALEPFSVYPSLSGANISDEERDARKVLNDLGITDTHFKQNGSRDSRSSVTGTYRIVLHRIHKRRLGISESSSSESFKATGNQTYSTSGRVNHASAPPVSKQSSKLCTIL